MELQMHHSTSHWQRTRRKKPPPTIALAMLLLLPASVLASTEAGNCFRHAEESSWGAVFRHNASEASLHVVPTAAGPVVANCLQEQSEDTEVSRRYSFEIIRYSEELVFEKEFKSLQLTPSELLPRSYRNVSMEKEENKQQLWFQYLVLPGNYSVRISLSCRGNGGNGGNDTCPEDEEEEDFNNTRVVESAPVALVNTSTEASCTELTATNKYYSSGSPFTVSAVSHVDNVNARFTFAFPAFDCGGYIPNEMARVQLLSARNNDSACDPARARVEADVLEPVKQNVASLELHVEYKSNRVGGDRFYCARLIRDEHMLCARQIKRDEGHFASIRPRIAYAPVASRPSNSSIEEEEEEDPFLTATKLADEAETALLRFHSPLCVIVSRPVFLESRPFIANYIPFCTSHFRCGWLYIAVVGSAVLVFSCVLAFCLVYCRCCCRTKKKRVLSPDERESIPFEGLCLNDTATGTTQVFVPKKSWLELHEEWDREPPKNPGKILFLYSPDSPSFKELQQAFKDFMELACHCVVLDLFDEELLREFALDPELWLSNLLRDPDFKIVVMCSEGAYKRQQALLDGEVLNIPHNSAMDGLFSAGLKFIQDKHAYDYNRLALARYEMLHLTSADFRLREMVPNREFLVPTQLHDLFCWIHGYDPLDLMGKPWDRYHLELTLLQDALRTARKDPGRR